MQEQIMSELGSKTCVTILQDIIYNLVRNCRGVSEELYDVDRDEPRTRS